MFELVKMLVNIYYEILIKKEGLPTMKMEDIRNIAVLGHGKCGKTTMTEAMLFNAKQTDRLGKVADGNTVTDCDPEEIKRGLSI